MGEQEIERQKKMKEEEEKRQRQAERMAKLKAEQEALREENERRLQAAASAAYQCAFVAMCAVEEAHARIQEVSTHLKKTKHVHVEPAFYQRLREELDDEEFVELLQQSPSAAANFGLSKHQFKELKQYAKFKGVVF